MQVITHEASARDGSVTFYGRARDGSPVVAVVPCFRTVWVRDACLPGPGAARFAQGRGLLADDPTTQFHEYWLARPPRGPAACRSPSPPRSG